MLNYSKGILEGIVNVCVYEREREREGGKRKCTNILSSKGKKYLVFL